jgi:hypothetical protein
LARLLLNWDKIKSIAHFVDMMSGILRTVDQCSAPKGDVLPWASDKLLDLFRDKTPVPQKQSIQGEGFGGARLIPTSFNPGDKKQVLQPIQMNLNIDGRTLAQAITEILQDLTNHPTAAPAPNGQLMSRSVDGNWMAV